MNLARRFTVFSVFLLIITVFFSCENPKQDPENYSPFEKAEYEWQENRANSMTSKTSWLTIAGLFWLEEGENSFGTDKNAEIILPENSAPLSAGRFILKNDEVKVIPAPGAELKIEGKKIGEMVLKSEVIELNDLRMWVIKRGDRYAIRLRDFNAPAYKNYQGLDFFQPNQQFKINADLISYPTPKSITVATVVGNEVSYNCRGYVKFIIDGKEYRLDAFDTSRGANILYFIFKDATSGHETYGSSRFMYSDILADGSVDLNFNRAYNPPCAYTPYATCPLPPPQNILAARIEAGEKNYGNGH